MCFYTSTSLFFHFLIFIYFLVSTASSTYFNISRFDREEKEILYQGDAINVAGNISFNKVNYVNRVGRAIYRKPIHLWDASTGEVSDFSTLFSFNIDTQSSPSYGHGFVFFLAPVGFPIPTNSAGGFLGLFNTSTAVDASNQLVLVEFDTFPNPEWDPPTEHVGININSISSAVYDTGWNASLHSGETVNTWITYNASSRNLTVLWNFGADNRQYNHSLSYQIDVRQVLPAWVTAGFSASTGTFVERHILHSWEFSSNLEDKLQVRSQLGKIKLILGLLIPFVFLIGLVVIAYVISQRKTWKTEEANHSSISFETSVGPKRFTYKDLALATNNFSANSKLGQGGFGAVYKGYLCNLDMDVAVKKISRDSKQGKKEYITEVKIISQLRHRNLVQLLGWCHERGKFLLVYDYMSHGSLDFHLFGNRSVLTWPVRYNIALGLASALLYLHEGREKCVVHRDIKSSNVMLDSEFNTKLGDFGLARLMDHNLGLTTTGLAGTIGYMAPEYVCTGKASKKSDVYSFGVVALEIACGRKSVDINDDESPVGLVQWVWALHREGQLLKTVDARLCMEFDTKQLECLLTVGLWCSHPDQNQRPPMKQVIQVLNFDIPSPSLPQNMPVLMYRETDPLLCSHEPSLTYNSLAIGR